MAASGTTNEDKISIPSIGAVTSSTGTNEGSTEAEPETNVNSRRTLPGLLTEGERDRSRLSKTSARSRKSSAKSTKAVTGKSKFSPTKDKNIDDYSSDDLCEETEADDSDYDTDLDIEETKEEFDPTGRKAYKEACSHLGVVPVSYVLEHISEGEVNIKHHGLGPNGAKAIATALMNNTMITKINIRDCGVGSVGGESIAKLLKENFYITELDIAQNGLRSTGAVTLSEVITENNTLRVVNLSRNEFRNKDAEVLAEAMRANHTITWLDLSHNEFAEEAGEFFGPALDANDSLQYLNLSWNHLRGPGAIAIGKGLRANCTLQVLDLSWNGFADEGACAVGDSLKENNTLTELDLSNNRITNAGAQCVASGIKVNNTLQVLKIGLNPIRSIGAHGILQATKDNYDSALEKLYFNNVVIDLDTQELVRQILQERPNIKIICTLSSLAGNNSDLEVAVYEAKKKKTVKDLVNIMMDYVKSRNLRLVDLFNQFDKDKSMSVDREEFVRGLRSIGVPLDDRQLSLMIDFLDEDGDGEVDYSEFTWIREEYEGEQ